ncbi:MAG: hypothetical protein ACJAVU_001346 [Cognaticolwellia sp.]|jgi:hypothetical protein
MWLIKKVSAQVIEYTYENSKIRMLLITLFDAFITKHGIVSLH